MLSMMPYDDLLVNDLNLFRVLLYLNQLFSCLMATLSMFDDDDRRYLHCYFY